MDGMTALALGMVLTIAALWVLRQYAQFPSQKASEYADNLPLIDLKAHLDGKLACDGMIFGPTGRVTSRFRAIMNTTWDGPKGVMDEHFIYDDGSTQDRQWRLTVADDGSVRAEADDVIGAGRGRMAGNAFGMRYRIRLPEKSGGHVLDAVDWMYLQEDGTILNRSQFTKFGVKVAELFATIRPIEPTSEKTDA
ncbi:DUF3833 domain-containing protein [Jannaschia pohangensis]|uniref:DUF3833 domain-containing protein n=1 Tax=Jannaschia pohangensis TaxID=390807 RepID=A0A1I3Q1X7_9RHOB|nr:DUF3833 domain-containing protein [Jannaschia pohangensis]SFJ27622.1 Protein of unknown function [Jannaschia pohangensis]